MQFKVISKNEIGQNLKVLSMDKYGTIDFCWFCFLFIVF